VIPASRLHGASTPRPRPGLASVELDGERVVLDEASGALHLLDPVASVVWSCLDGSATIDELVVDLAAGFGADADEVGADVLGLVRRLGGLGLLEGVAADGGTADGAAADGGTDPVPPGPGG